MRNITGCHLAGACPFEVLDISPWAEAAFRHFLHHPVRAAAAPQVQDQLLGLRHRLRPGHVQRRRRRRRVPPAARRHHRGRFPGLCRRRPGGQPPPGPGAGGVHPPRGAAWPRSRRSCGPSTTTATGTTSSVPASSGWSTPWASTSCAAHPEGAQAAARLQSPGREASRRSSRSSATPPPGVAGGVVAHARRHARSPCGSAPATPTSAGNRPTS